MKRFCFLFIAICLSGCTGMRYGNFTEISQSRDIYLAKDAVSQLAHIYPPAKHTFHLSQKSNDSFGINLVHEMRKKGYGVIENTPQKQKADFFYVVDRIGNYYRVSLYIHSQTLSRVYSKAGEKFGPVSPWSYRE